MSWVPVPPRPEEIAHAVQVLCAAVNLDPVEDRVLEVKINSDGEVTVRRPLIGIHLVPLMEADGEHFKITETTWRVVRLTKELFQSPNPFRRQK